MKTKYFLLFSMVSASIMMSCKHNNTDTQTNVNTHSLEIIKIGLMLDSFNHAAASADYDKYFDFFSENAVFIGTDATEYWTKGDFMVWAKPYFDKKKTWDFSSVERHIYFDKHSDIAWFDELLDTQMKICRGSGVVINQNGKWEIKQYVLSMTIPNSNTKDVVKLKASEEDSLLKVKR